MPDRYSEAEIERARLCVELLPEPGCEVALRLIATLDAIKAERDRAVEAVEAVETLRKAAMALVAYDDSLPPCHYPKPCEPCGKINDLRTALAAAKKEE